MARTHPRYPSDPRRPLWEVRLGQGMLLHLQTQCAAVSWQLLPDAAEPRQLTRPRPFSTFFPHGPLCVTRICESRHKRTLPQHLCWAGSKTSEECASAFFSVSPLLTTIQCPRPNRAMPFSLPSSPPLKKKALFPLPPSFSPLLPSYV